MRRIKPEDNLGLAMDAVRRFMPHLRNQPLGQSDEFQDACVGLCVAAQRYKNDRNAQFSTYAYFWMKAFVFRGMGHKHGYRYNKQPAQFSQLKTRTDKSRHQYDPVELDMRRPEALPVSAADEAVENERQAGDGPAGQLIKDALRFLTGREKRIIELRLQGLNLRQVGLKMKLSFERVRQLEERAHVKLYKQLMRRGVRTWKDVQSLIQ